jgi:hypothetical protein
MQSGVDFAGHVVGATNERLGADDNPAVREKSPSFVFAAIDLSP